jgi:hypothetical protein
MSAPDDKQTLHNLPKTERKLGEDVSDRAHKMPRDTALLYRNRSPRDTASAHYQGVSRLSNGTLYWITLWVRSIHNQPVLEIKLTRKEDDQ